MSKDFQIVASYDAPEAIGPYSQAVIANGLVFCSGQIALDAGSKQIVGETAGEQTVKVMANLLAVLEAAGCSLSDIIKTTIYLKDMDDFESVNKAYAAALNDHRPARATVEVSRLPKDVLVEIDCVAKIP
jgi:2-iminobutanoate/2-iminopropanoate deaminase